MLTRAYGQPHVEHYARPVRAQRRPKTGCANVRWHLLLIIAIVVLVLLFAITDGELTFADRLRRFVDRLTY